MGEIEIDKVVFLKDASDDVFAFFPELAFDNDDSFRTSYAHVGQHSACHITYAFECERATKKEYTPLVIELEELGYNLEILNREE